ncbi:integrase, partial [Pseudomonas sp. IB20]
ALDRGPPPWAILGPSRLNRRPAGLPTLQSLRSASVV